MVGDVDFITWSRFGPSDEPTSADFSKVKGVVRNLLLNVIARHLSTQAVDSQTQIRLVFDFDKGLFRVKRTKLGTKGQPVKDWRVLDREFVTADPIKATQILLGPDVTAHDVRTLEGLVTALRKSPKTKDQAQSILRDFLVDLREFSDKNPKLPMPSDLESILGLSEGLLRHLSTGA
jgi:hypothetical protein